MKVSELKQSNFLKKEDCGNGILVTIRECREENIAKDGAPHEMRWILYFDEQEKGMVLNSTNGQIIQSITGSDDSDNWAGRKIVLYHDPSVIYAGKLVGGIRVRAPRNQPAQNKAQGQSVQPPPASAIADEDVPF